MSQNALIAVLFSYIHQRFVRNLKVESLFSPCRIHSASSHSLPLASCAPKEDMPLSSGPGDLADAAKRLAAMRIGSGPRTGVGIEARSWASSKMGQAMRTR